MIAYALLAFQFCQLPPVLNAENPAAMGQALRNLLLQKMPTPLLVKDTKWGTQKAFETIKFDPKHPLTPIKETKMKNDGNWKRLEVEGLNLQNTLVVGVDKVVSPEPGVTRFEVNVRGPIRVTFLQQIWKDGVKLYSGETRARCDVGAILQCEVRSELKFQGLIPELNVKFKILEAKVGYDHLTVEHTLGLGGEAAKMVGNTLVEFVKQIKPSLEKELLEKANAALVKAGKEREFRIALGKLLGEQKKARGQ